MTEQTSVPQPLAAALAKSWGYFTEQLEATLWDRLQTVLGAPTLSADFDRLLATSEFFRDQFIRHHNWALTELEAGRLFQHSDLEAASWEVALQALVIDNTSDDEVMSALRIFRNRQM